MSLERRKAIVDVVRRFKDVHILEDDAYRFLHASPLPSFLALAPERTIHLYSLSKAFNPMLKSGYAIHPKNVLPEMGNIVRMQSSGASLLFLHFGLHLIESGLLQKIMEEKRAVAERSAEMWKDIFNGADYQHVPEQLSLLAGLQGSRRNRTKAAAAKHRYLSRGMFSLTGDNQYVRVALGTCWDKQELPDALRRVAAEL